MNGPAAAGGGHDPARPHVMHLITSLHTGGAEGMLERLVTAPGERPLRTSVVSLTPGGAVRERLQAAGVAVSDLGMRRAVPDPRALVRLVRLLRSDPPQVLQSWMYHADALALPAVHLAGLRRRLRLYWGVRCSNMDPAAYGWQLRPLIGACARLARRVDAVVANSLAGRAHHRALGYRPPAFPVIFNGIDTAHFAPLPAARQALRTELGIGAGTLLLACVARVDAMKGHTLLLEAARGVPGVALLLIGEGTRALHDGQLVYGLGRRDDVPRWLAAADAIVSSSLFGEGFSNAIAEGMACALPALVTDVGDARHMVGDCGRVVAPGDGAALAAAMAALLSRPPAERLAEGARARQRIEARFSMPACVQRFDCLHLHGAPALPEPAA